MAMLVLERDFADHRVHFALAVVLQQDFDGGVVPEDVSSDRNQRLISNLHNEAGLFEPSLLFSIRLSRPVKKNTAATQMLPYANS
jgi:hypothetical protein